MASLPVRVIAAGEGGAAGPVRLVAGRGIASAVGLPPICDPVMPELHIETIRAQVLIMASLGRYLAISGHDHELLRSEGLLKVPGLGL